ncbi:MAG: cobyrinate a,c-diamide synthase [Deltaproteobacteria bacterium]|nr:cobyrinate a,c-diamide synthase [Deltaproteobacteria bacterium]
MGTRIKALSIGATGSGAGKTTVTLALLAALRRRGLRVQPFKAGPDFIDPGHHFTASGLISHNLDTWMLSPEENRAIFARHACQADLAVVEGVMGLFDGFGPEGEEGSTAHLAKLLGIPAVLVVNAKGMAGSIAAMAGGFQNFDPDLRWAGVIANKCGSFGHIQILRRAMSSSSLMPLLGGLLRASSLSMPERHLGLITAEEGGLAEDTLQRLADLAEEAIDLDRLLESLPEVAVEAPMPQPPVSPKVRIGVARDQAFCFYYEENLRRLRRAGAELVPFSPMRDAHLPSNLQGLYLGGGYPELFAPILAENIDLRCDIAAAARNGLPIFGECGGMIYLGRSLRDLEGRVWPMCKVLPLDTAMNPKLRRLGYRQATFVKDTPLGPQGAVARGHEFHYSEITTLHGGASEDLFQLSGRNGSSPAFAGLRVANTLGSYLHFHFGSNPKLAEHFVAFCRRNA